MSKLILAVVLGLLAVQQGLASPQAEQFTQAGFTKKTVIGCLVQKSTGAGELVRLMPGPGLVDSALEELGRIEPPQTKEVEVRYVLSLFTGSSEASQKLEVFMDDAGDGYFRKGTDFVVYFFSPGLAKLLREQKEMGPSRGGIGVLRGE